ESAVGAERDDDAPHAAAQQVYGAVASLMKVVHRHAGERLGLGFIGDQVIGVSHLDEIERLAGRRVQYGADAVGACEAKCVIDGFERDLQLQDDRIGLLKHRRGGVNIGGQQAVIGAL